MHVGSHDPVLDLLARHLADPTPPDRSRRLLVSRHAGSLAGLTALRHGQAHLAAVHLLDPDTGEYNLPYLRRHLPEIPTVLVTLLHREQGLMVPRGNPQGLTGPADLARTDVRIVNRPPGTGTRVLLDHQLEQLGIDPAAVTGYQREEPHSAAVAAAVRAGQADCGLGTRPAATSAGLDFVHLAWERYDLAIPTEHHDSDLLRPLLDLLHDDTYRQAVARQPGYDATDTGNILTDDPNT